MSDHRYLHSFPTRRSSDLESIVRDLVEIAIDMVREEKMEDVEDKAELNAEDRLLDLLLPAAPAQAAVSARPAGPAAVMMTPTGIRAMQVMQIPAEPAGGHAIEG